MPSSPRRFGLVTLALLTCLGLGSTRFVQAEESPDQGGWSAPVVLQSSDARMGDRFGRVVALSGNTLAVGKRYEESWGGSVTVFMRPHGAWGELTTLDVVHGDAHQPLRGTVAVSGDTLAVGVGGRSYPGGAVCVFTRSGMDWNQQAFLYPSEAGPEPDFGAALALSGDTLVVGAEGQSNRAGAAYVYTRSGTTWTLQTVLRASNADAGDFFAKAVAIDGDTIAVGAPLEASSPSGGSADNSSYRCGAVYVFARSGTTWSEQAFLKASDGEEVDSFGEAVALSGETLVVGASGADADEEYEQTGAAYVFARSGTTWNQQAVIAAPYGRGNEAFGQAVAVAVDRIAVGATGVAQGAGAAYVFGRRGSAWSQQARLMASNATSNDFFGYSVALTDTTLAVGAPQKAGSARSTGEVSVYKR